MNYADAALLAACHVDVREHVPVMLGVVFATFAAYSLAAGLLFYLKQSR